ncbi:phosphoribulokinase [Thiothrix subterranea]|uniref:phosphoribulokinase n=1 Tax=Thiothrix subterranea TaxID=2735563 RepID=A0AA51MLH1_9GAMM|nr:phosphoribulokinase [Thiothrix subterranea]MDQ5770815.1 phosphoribulokinase [Thiothrix subterranea]WML85859.1 phosphoribulokinase [Thiothrix subterranea]
MSAKHPIVAITGAMESGSVSVIQALERIFYRERVKAVYIDGSAFRRYDRTAMRDEVRKAQEEGRVLGHFGPEGNHLDKLESLFFEYAAVGRGLYRHYLHTAGQAAKYGQAVGTFTPWEPMDPDSDLLLYRGLHGAALVDDIDIAQYPDLSIGISPNANLEWMAKIQHEIKEKGVALEDAKTALLNRLHDYVHHITPQFMRTHINFQLIPLVDTSDPFGAEAVPTPDECYLVMRFAPKFLPDFIPLLHDIPGAFMSRRNTLVVPSSKMLMAIELVLMPIIHNLIDDSRQLRGITDVPEDRGAGVLGLVE